MNVEVKKFIVALAFFMALLTLSCGGGKEKNNLPTVSFMCDNSATTLAILQEEIVEFEKEYGVKVTLLPFTGQEKLYAMMAAGTPPDVFYTNNVMRDQLAAEGKIIDFRSIAGSDSFAKAMRREAIDQGTSLDGGWYQLVNSTFTYGIYYNKKFFDEVGLRYPDSLWTWDDLVAIAQRLTKSSNGRPDRYGVNIPYFFVDAFERMNHAQFPKPGLVAVAPNESIETFRWYRDLTEKHHVMPTPLWIESLGMETFQLLETGRVAMMIEMVPLLGMYQFLTIEWDVAPLPRREGKSPLYFRGGSGGFSISAASKYPDAAWKFLTWWVSRSEINFPSPMVRDVDFVGAWEQKVPYLKRTHFADVWKLSEEHSGGDWRNFVRYSSWTYNVFEEQLNPKYEQMLKGSIAIEEYVNAIPEVNRKVLEELNRVLSNPDIKTQFKVRITEELKNVEELVKK